MPKYYDASKTRASVCHWDLTFRFLNKEQCLKFISKYLEMTDYTLSLGYHAYPSEENPNRMIYSVTIEDMVWANNLAIVAELLKEVDHEMN